MKAEKVSIKGMSREEWLKLRKTGIGGSEAGAVCGFNPYASPFSVYINKISDDTEQEDNEAMRQGRDLEDYVAKRFTEATGKKVRKSNFMYRSNLYHFMLANVDRLVEGEDAGLECKTVSAYNADKWKDEEIPQHYFLQCQHYMAVTGLSCWYIAAVILGKDFKWAKIERDEELIMNLIKVESDFWNQHVVPGVLPGPDGSRAYDEVLEKYFGTAKRNEAIPLIGFDGKLKRRDEITELQEKLKTEQAQIDQELKTYLAENESAVNEKYRVSWSNVDTNRIDTGRLKTEEPETYRKYLKIVSGRRFSVKKVA